MKIEAIVHVSDCTPLWAEWQELHRSIYPQTPFTSPLWNMTWWKHYSKASNVANYTFFLHTVRDENDTLQAVVPWMIVTRPAFGPVQIRTLTFFGADQSLTELRGIICRPDSEARVVMALRDYLRDIDIRYDVIEWVHVKSLSAFEILEKDGPLGFSQVLYMYVLPLPTSMDAFYAKLSSSTRKYIRRSYEKASTLNESLTLNVISCGSEFSESMKRLIDLHRARAKARDMFTHPNRFNSRINHQFIFEVFDSLFFESSALIFELKIGKKVVACRLSFVLDSTLYMYYSGYDPRFRKYNVGSVLMAEIIQWSIRNNFKTLNLSAGKDTSKLQWKPTEYVFQSGLHLRPTLRGSLISHGYGSVRRLRNRRRAIARKQ